MSNSERRELNRALKVLGEHAKRVLAITQNGYVEEATGVAGFTVVIIKERRRKGPYTAALLDGLDDAAEKFFEKQFGGNDGW